MKRRFEPVTSQILAKIERDKVYKQHIRTMSMSMKGAVDCSQPELSPRHRIIAQRAAQKNADIRKMRQSRVRSRTRSRDMPLPEPSSRLSSRDTSDQSYAAALFPSPPALVVPGELDFLSSYHDNTSRLRTQRSGMSSLSNSTFIQFDENESDSDEVLELSSDSSLSSASSDSFGVSDL